MCVDCGCDRGRISRNKMAGMNEDTQGMLLFCGWLFFFGASWRADVFIVALCNVYACVIVCVVSLINKEQLSRATVRETNEIHFILV